MRHLAICTVIIGIGVSLTTVAGSSGIAFESQSTYQSEHAAADLRDPGETDEETGWSSEWAQHDEGEIDDSRLSSWDEDEDVDDDEFDEHEPEERDDDANLHESITRAEQLLEIIQDDLLTTAFVVSNIVEFADENVAIRILENSLSKLRDPTRKRIIRIGLVQLYAELELSDKDVERHLKALIVGS